MAATVCLGERMKKVESPCYKCEDRVVGCHGTCERYQTYAGIMANNRDERNERKIKSTKLSAKKSRTQLKQMGSNKEKW